MGPVQAIKTCLAKSVQFEGRASRTEFWWFILFIALLQTLAVNVSSWAAGEIKLSVSLTFGLGTNEPWPINIYSALFFLPTIAVLARRAHDAGVAASNIIVMIFLLFVALVFISKFGISPTSFQNLIYLEWIVGIAFLLFLTLRPSQPRPNHYGPNPLEVTP